MVSVMTKGSDVFGSCVEVIDVSVEGENGGVLHCCGQN
jgi:hypothetical protein